MANKPNIYFVASELGEVHHGPAVYTRALWDLFHDHDDFDFHLVVLKSDLKHPKIHVPANESGKRRGFYQRLESHIKASVPSDRSTFLLHVNAAHLISSSLAARYQTLVQINDTEVCQHSISRQGAKKYGWRRMLALQWRRMRERAVTKKSKQVVCNSDFTSQMVRESYNLPFEKVTRIYKAVPLQTFLEQSPDCEDSNILTALFIGNNWRRKGLQTLIEAIAMIVQNHPEIPVKLEVYGNPSTAESNQFLQLANSLGVKKYVNFAGILTRDAAPVVISSSSMLVLPSFEEALGLVCIEAIATGIPVVGSEVGGIPEVINDARLGRLTKPGDSNALATAMLKQYHMGSDLETIRFRKESSQRFSVTKLRHNIDLLYRNHTDPCL